MVFSFLVVLTYAIKNSPGGKIGETMIIYVDGMVVDVDCDIYDPFPEPVEDGTDEEVAGFTTPIMKG